MNTKVEHFDNKQDVDAALSKYFETKQRLNEAQIDARDAEHRLVETVIADGEMIDALTVKIGRVRQILHYRRERADRVRARDFE